MIDESKKWIYSYTLPCTQGNQKVFEHLLKHGKFVPFLRGDYSKKSVMDYFFGPHNLAHLNMGHVKDSLHRSLGYDHLALPYNMGPLNREGLVTQVNEICDVPAYLLNKRFSLDELLKAKDLGVLDVNDEIVVAHAGVIAGTCLEKDIEQYADFFKRLAAA